MTYWQKKQTNSHTATTKPFLAAKYVLHTSFLSQVLDDSYDAERKTTCSKDEAQLKLPTGAARLSTSQSRATTHWYIMPKHQGSN